MRSKVCMRSGIGLSYSGVWGETLGVRERENV